jgi:UDP-N-acetylglucosamine acyltransferase
VISSFAGLAGHVEVGDYAVLGAYTGVHQFARIGESVMSAANSKLSKDAPPFALVAGDRARLLGLNRVGLLRRGLDVGVRDALKRAFHLLFHSKLRMRLALERVRSEVPGVTEVDRLLEFIERSERGFCR